MYTAGFPPAERGGQSILHIQVNFQVIEIFAIYGPEILGIIDAVHYLFILEFSLFFVVSMSA